MKILSDAIDLNKFFEQLKYGSLLLLDYDGTLAPFVKERMKASPYPGVNERLLDLTNNKKTRVVIVSGRSIKDLESLIDLPRDLELWGSHGLEKRLPNGTVITAEIDPELGEATKKAIRICLEGVDPTFCEIKPFSVACHNRGMSDAELQKFRFIERAWEKLASESGMENHHFDGGIELRPKWRNKGDVVYDLLQEVPKEFAVAYLGDDMTDEEAFYALGKRGLKVLVRKELRKTLADIQLIPPDELLMFLDKWRSA